MTLEPTRDVEPGWRRTAGVKLLGPASGSGLVQKTFLVERPDGQVIQISELLNLVILAAEEGSTAAELSEEVSEAYGKELDSDGVHYLIEQKLLPLGLIEDVAGEVVASSPPPTARPLLALSLKGTILPERMVRHLSTFLAPLYWPPVVVMALVALVGLDVYLLVGSDFMGALEQVLLTPVLFLGLFLMMVVGALVHELGHATACKYGGARPGVIGYGVYLVFPAFYTDVTASYQLGRRGRLRTDLGGLYFNVLCVLLAGGAFLLGGNAILLLFVLLTQIQMLQQLPPTIRLDGYFVLADLAGVPDLFSRVGPVMRSLIPGREKDPRVLELKPHARRIVTIWVVTVIPALVLVFAWLLWNLPAIIAYTVGAIAHHVDGMQSAFAEGQPLGVAISALSVLLLALPLAGILMMIQRVAAAATKFVRRRRATAAEPDTGHATQPLGRVDPSE